MAKDQDALLLCQSDRRGWFSFDSMLRLVRESGPLLDRDEGRLVRLSGWGTVATDVLMPQAGIVEYFVRQERRQSACQP